MDCLELLAHELDARRSAALVTIVSASPHSPLQPGHKLLVGTAGLLAGHAPNAEIVTPLVEAGRAALASGRSGARDLQIGGAQVRAYVEPYLSPPILLVVGAGHIAQVLASIGRLVGFDIWVLDDRREYANEQRFPTADRVIYAPFIEALDELDLGPTHHVVLVTRGHHYDMRCLHNVITRPVAYIGMIGSRIRVETVFKLLAEDYGVDPDLFEKVHAPIGLDIGALTPAEIAVAVVAEVVKARRGGTGQSLSRLERTRIHDPRPERGGTRDKP